MRKFILEALKASSDGVFLSLGHPRSSLQYLLGDLSVSVERRISVPDISMMQRLSALRLRRPIGCGASLGVRELLVGQRSGMIHVPLLGLKRAASVDELVASFTRCSLLEFSGCADAALLLKGARTVLSEQKPTVLLTGSIEQRREGDTAIRAFLAPAGYEQVLDDDEGTLFVNHAAKERGGMFLELARFEAKLRRSNTVYHDIADTGLYVDSHSIDNLDEGRLGVWTTQKVTRFLLTFPKPGLWKVAFVIDDYACDVTEGLGLIRHFGREEGQTEWSDFAQHLLSASLQVSGREVLEGCVITIHTKNLGWRSLPGKGRHVGLRIRGVQAQGGE